MSDELDLAAIRDQIGSRIPVVTLCLGGPLHGLTVHVDRERWHCESPSEGKHAYRRAYYTIMGADTVVYVHEAMSADDAMASLLVWSDVA